MELCKQKINIMKVLKLFVSLIVILLIFSSCNKKAEQQSQNTDSSAVYKPDTLTIPQENPLIKEYRHFLASLDTTKAESALKATDKYKSVFNGQSAGLCDSAFVYYQAVLDTIENELNLKLQDDTTDYSVPSDPATAQKLTVIKKNLATNGFKVSYNEGMMYIEQNRNTVYQQLSPMLSDPMKAYLKELELEHREGFATDEAIVISPRKHVDRIIWYENFMKANPKFVFADNCNNYKKAYLTYLITGFDNTKLFSNRQDMQLSHYFSTAYSYLFQKYPQSNAASLLKPYFTAISQKQAATMKDLKKQYIIKGYIYDL